MGQGSSRRCDCLMACQWLQMQGLGLKIVALMSAPSPSPSAIKLPEQQLESSAALPVFYQAGAYGLDDSWAYLMRQVLSASLRQVAEVLADQDLPSVQWMPLLRLAAGQRCTVVALARDLGVDAATMTRAADKLVAKGWVERQRCDKDRRQVELRITDLGRSQAKQLQPMLTQVLNGPLAGFSHADWQLLLSLLRRMKAASCQMAPADCEAAQHARAAGNSPAAGTAARPVSSAASRKRQVRRISGSNTPASNKKMRQIPGTG